MVQVRVVNNARAEHDWLTQQTRTPQSDTGLLVARYDRPAVVLGCSQRPDQDMTDRAAHNHIDLVRRRAGGGAVLADSSLFGLSMLFPPGHPLFEMDAVAAYQAFAVLWESALAAQNVSVAMATVPHITRSKAYAVKKGIDWACYGALGHGELLANGERKLLGVAQVRTRHCVAMVTGLQTQPVNWRLLCRVYGKPALQAMELETVNTDLETLGVTEIPRVCASLVDWFRANSG